MIMLMSDYLQQNNLIPNTGFVPSNLSTSFMSVPYPKSFADVFADTRPDTSNFLQSDLNAGRTNTLPPPNTNGWSGLAFSDKALLGLGAFNSALSAINSYKANKLGKQQLAFAKDSFNRNFEAQKGITNSQLADRQNIRYKVNPTDNMPVADYMAQYGVK